MEPALCGPDAQRVAGFDAGDGAAAGAHLVDVHHRNLDRQGALVAADQRRAGGERPAFADDPGLGRGATHVEGDGVAHAELGADGLSTDHAGRGAGFQHAHAVAPGMGAGEQAAGGLHHVKVALEALRAQVLLQLAQVGRDTRAHIGVGHGGGDAFELAVLLAQLVRGADERVGQLFLQDLLDALLVRRVAVRVQQQHGHRLDALASQLLGQLAHGGFVQRLVGAAIGAQALGHLEAQRALHQRLVLVEKEVVGIGAVDAADFVDVAETFGDQQRGVGAVALQQRVDRDGGTVQEQVAVLQVDLCAVQRGLDAVDQLAVGGQGLAEQQLAGGFVKSRHVGEGAADVDGDAQLGLGAHGCLSRVQAAEWSVPMRLRSTPRPVISTSARSPSFMYSGGSRRSPTPPGVPVAITSPGASGVKRDT